MTRVPIFVIDDHDIDLYEDAQAAASEVEGYDVMDLDFIGVDGTVHYGTTKGHKWGPVTLHPTQENRLAYLVDLLRAEARSRNVAIPSDTPDDPELIWAAVRLAEREARLPRRRWWFRFRPPGEQ